MRDWKFFVFANTLIGPLVTSPKRGEVVLSFLVQGGGRPIEKLDSTCRNFLKAGSVMKFFLAKAQVLKNPGDNLNFYRKRPAEGRGPMQPLRTPLSRSAQNAKSAGAVLSHCTL